MFKKKSTKELVRTATPETIEKKEPQKNVKEKKRTFNKNGKLNFLRSKQFLGVMCIVAALLICFAGVPFMTAKLNETVPVVVFTEGIPRGSKITSEMVKINQMAMYNLPLGVQSNVDAVVGKYLTTDALQGDIVTDLRLTAVYPGANPELATMEPGKMAVAITLSDLAESVSSKIREGDIIQLFAVAENTIDAQSNAVAPQELQYVEVLSVSGDGGVDVSDLGEETMIRTVTLSVNRQQAAVLIGLEHTATLHAALVIRGNSTAKAAALAEQENLFSGQTEAVGESIPEVQDVPEEEASADKVNESPSAPDQQKEE